jgi:hypothetical protein
LTIWDIGFIHLSEKDLDKQSCYSANDFGLLTKIQGDSMFVHSKTNVKYIFSAFKNPLIASDGIVPVMDVGLPVLEMTQQYTSTNFLDHLRAMEAYPVLWRLPQTKLWSVTNAPTDLMDTQW